MLVSCIEYDLTKQTLKPVIISRFSDHQVQLHWRELLFAAVKSFDANIAISVDFAITAKNTTAVMLDIFELKSANSSN